MFSFLTFGVLISSIFEKLFVVKILFINWRIILVFLWFSDLSLPLKNLSYTRLFGSLKNTVNPSMSRIDRVQLFDYIDISIFLLVSRFYLLISLVFGIVLLGLGIYLYSWVPVFIGFSRIYLWEIWNWGFIPYSR